MSFARFLLREWVIPAGTTPAARASSHLHVVGEVITTYRAVSCWVIRELVLESRRFDSKSGAPFILFNRIWRP